jgi:hypothetical protein
MPDSKPLRMFCSYSHRDEEYVNDLRDSLRGLERQGLIEWWHDRQIVPGWEWEEAIDKNLRTADVVILLVSRDFMASDYVYEKEIDKAIERHARGEARVIPIIVRPAAWEETSFGKLQALPKDGKPVTTWPNQDEAWLDVLRGIRKAVGELLRERHEQAATEAAKRKAKELGVDLSLVEGSGINGRITVKDVVGAAKFLNRTVLRTSEESAVVERTQEQPARSIITASNARRVGLLRTLEDWVITSVGFSPDGKLLALGSNDNKVRLWRVEDGVLLRTFEKHTDQAEVISLAFSPDGKLLAAGSNAEAVRLWRVEDGELLRTLVHEMLAGVAFSPDGKLLATGALMMFYQGLGGNYARLWRVEDGASLRTLEGHTDQVYSVGFSPDGSLLASGSLDGTVRLWGIA